MFGRGNNIEESSQTLLVSTMKNGVMSCFTPQKLDSYLKRNVYFTISDEDYKGVYFYRSYNELYSKELQVKLFFIDIKNEILPLTRGYLLQKFDLEASICENVIIIRFPVYMNDIKEVNCLIFKHKKRFITEINTNKVKFKNNVVFMQRFAALIIEEDDSLFPKGKALNIDTKSIHKKSVSRFKKKYWNKKRAYKYSKM
jgi:hypothetical protein